MAWTRATAWVSMGRRAAVLLLLLSMGFGAGCGGEDGAPGEGPFGRFRLVSRHRLKKVADLKIFTRKEDPENAGTFVWQDITGELQDSAWSPVDPLEYHMGHFEAGQLNYTHGVKVEWQMEGEADPRSLEVTYGSGKAIRYVLLVIDPECEGHGTLHLLRGGTKGVDGDGGEGRGRFRLNNLSGREVIKFEIASRVEDSGALTWKACTNAYMENAATKAVGLATGLYWDGHAPGCFDAVKGLQVTYRVAGQADDQVIQIDEGDATNFGTFRPVKEATLTLYPDPENPANTLGRLTLHLPDGGVAVEVSGP